MVVPWLSSSRPCSERLLMPTSRSLHFKRGRDSAGTAKKKIAPVDSGKTRRRPAAPGKYRRLSAPPGGLRRQPAAPAKLRGGGRKPAALTVTNGSRCKPTSRSKVAAQQADAQVNGRDLCFLCGSVDELDVEHAHRHACSHARQDAVFHCPRCLWLYSRADIERVSPWVGPRPRHLGGFWALGCRVCAVAMKDPEFAARRRSHMVANQKHGFCKQAISRTGKWSHYQVRICGTPRDLRHRLQAHACSDSHRLCADLVNSLRFLLGSAAFLRKGCSDAAWKAPRR